MSERRVQGRPESCIEHRRISRNALRDIGHCTRSKCRPLAQEFLSQRPDKGHSRTHFEPGPRRPGEVRAPHAIADDPMIGRIAPKVTAGSYDTSGRRRGSARQQAAEVSKSSAPRNPWPVWSLSITSKADDYPVPPSIELIHPRVMRRQPHLAIGRLRRFAGTVVLVFPFYGVSWCCLRYSSGRMLWSIAGAFIGAPLATVCTRHSATRPIAILLSGRWRAADENRRMTDGTQAVDG
jgi:hypothetical protein